MLERVEGGGRQWIECGEQWIEWRMVEDSGRSGGHWRIVHKWSMVDNSGKGSGWWRVHWRMMENIVKNGRESGEWSIWKEWRLVDNSGMNGGWWWMVNLTYHYYRAGGYPPPAP